MSKDKYFIGNPIFSQIIKILPFDRIRSKAKELQADRYTKKCDTLNHLITMLYGVISGCNSLREVCGGIVSYGNKISHCNLEYAIPRSTLADANKRRSAKVFEEIYEVVLKSILPNLSDSGQKEDNDLKLYAIDSTTISLFQSIFECVGRNPQEGKRKGGIKSHQKLDINTGMPVKIWHSDATKHDSVFIHMEGVMQSKEIAVMDKAYNNYKAFAKWNEGGVYFVTRLKENAKETLVRELDLSDSEPNEVLRDAVISLNYDSEEGEKKLELRLVSYYDTKKDRTFYFLTNILDIKAIEICDIYRKRWTIELFFKKIKQNFPLTYFYGDNRNA
ncbi:MAG TPA: IS4 family transposase, partial [Saprospiraceae bacterium]|nr:IS4 family transposase [Saprospiraceae bacterium]